MLTKGLMSSNTDDWWTPQELFDELNEEFHFTLDPCADEINAQCPTFFTKEQDGLKQDWGGMWSSATLPMAERSENGSKNATTIPRQPSC